jgi:hypothetical protein
MSMLMVLYVMLNLRNIFVININSSCNDNICLCESLITALCKHKPVPSIPRSLYFICVHLSRLAFFPTAPGLRLEQQSMLIR